MQLSRGVWQMSLAMIISGSIGAFVLLSGLPVIDVVFWRCLIGAVALLLFIILSRQPFSRLTRLTLALAVLGGVALVINWLLLLPPTHVFLSGWQPWSTTPSPLCWYY